MVDLSGWRQGLKPGDDVFVVRKKFDTLRQNHWIASRAVILDDYRIAIERMTASRYIFSDDLLYPDAASAQEYCDAHNGLKFVGRPRAYGGSL